MWWAFWMKPCEFSVSQDSLRKCSRNWDDGTSRTCNKFESGLLRCWKLMKSTCIRFVSISWSAPYRSLAIDTGSFDQILHQKHFEEYHPNHYHAILVVLWGIYSNHEPVWGFLKITPCLSSIWGSNFINWCLLRSMAGFSCSEMSISIESGVEGVKTA